MIKIIEVNSAGDQLEKSIMLFKEYAAELNENLCFQSFNAELQSPLKKYGPPVGALFIAYYNEELAGCIALQYIKEGTCEMKRLYVRPAFRKYGIANALVEKLLEKAKELGYEKMVLDTLQRLQPAINLYTKFGFKNTSAYYENPLAQVVYMEKDLTV